LVASAFSSVRDGRAWLPSRCQRGVDFRDRLTKRAFGAAPQEKPVVEASEPRSRLTLDHETVEVPAVGGHEVSLMMRIGHPALGALVLDELVLLEVAQSHSKLDLPPKKPNDDAGLVARGAPPRTGLDPDNAGPVVGALWWTSHLLTVAPTRDSKRASHIVAF
jgi:hypothetical protein